MRQSESYEQAFVEALSARSVPLIIWMLKKLDPSVALANLTQVVLISLVQQLGHDMSDEIVRTQPLNDGCLPQSLFSLASVNPRTLILLAWRVETKNAGDQEIKLTYLHEAALHLDKNDPAIAEHVGPVLTEVNDNITVCL